MKQVNSVWHAIYKDKGDAGLAKFKSTLLTFLSDYFEDNGFDKNKISSAIDITASEANDLQIGKLSKFTTDDLIKYLARLGYEINISKLIKDIK